MVERDGAPRACAIRVDLWCATRSFHIKAPSKGPEGNKVKLAVDPGVKRLNEVKVGDMVVVAYTEALAAEMIQQ